MQMCRYYIYHIRDETECNNLSKSLQKLEGVFFEQPPEQSFCDPKSPLTWVRWQLIEIESDMWIFLLFPLKVFCIHIHKLNIFTLMRMNVKWLFQEWPQQSFAFLVAGRYGIPTTGMNMVMSRVAFDNHLDFLWDLIPRWWKEVSS